LGRLLTDLITDLSVPAKHARDYSRLVELVPASCAEAVGKITGNLDHPATFRSANALLCNLIETRRNLLITPEYSRDPAAICPRYVHIADFPLADAKLALSLLGYC
jgi:hypothetical protein